MANLALIYPVISSRDFNSIQTIRKQHDPKYYNVVDPHITLVFGTDKLDEDGLVEHIRNKLNSFKTFKLNFDSTKVVEDDSKEFFHAILVPSDGFVEINQLHDTLYTDKLESELRHDIPFIPHIGVGNSKNKDEMEALVKRLKDDRFLATGVADKITVVTYDGIKVNNYISIPLS